MPADIRNFFGGRPDATAPKQEKAHGAMDDVCVLFSFFILWTAIAGSVPEYHCLKMTVRSLITYAILISLSNICFCGKEYANYSSYHSLEPATSAEVVRSSPLN
jgi:hypothetical protein